MQDLISKLKMYGFIRFLKYTFLELLWYRLFRYRVLGSYSQKGEDLIIDRLLGSQSKGFYADVGANDPIRFSNTKRFYDRGWRGINIEPDPKNFSKFVKDRPNDINLNIGVANQEGNLAFYRFIPDTLSTLCKSEADSYVQQGYQLLDTKEVPVMSLVKIFDEYIENNEIDFLSIDTEGYDMEVLLSNDWGKYKPKVICVESVIHSVEENLKNKDDDIDHLLLNLGYKKVATTSINSIYLLTL